MMNIRERHANGKAIVEYGIILGLVVIVAIPAWGFLGRVVSGGLFSEANTAKQGTEELGKLLSREKPNAVHQGFDIEHYNNDTLEITFNEETGLYEFINADEGGAPNPGTISNGIKKIAKAIEQMETFIDNEVAEEDQGAYVTMRKSLKELSQMAAEFGPLTAAFDQLSEYEKRKQDKYTIDKEESCDFLHIYCSVDYSSSQTQAATQEREDLFEAYNQFYEKLESTKAEFMAQNPQYDELNQYIEEQLTEYTDALGTALYTNYIDRYNMAENQVDPSINMSTSGCALGFIGNGCYKEPTTAVSDQLRALGYQPDEINDMMVNINYELQSKYIRNTDFEGVTSYITDTGNSVVIVDQNGNPLNSQYNQYLYETYGVTQQDLENPEVRQDIMEKEPVSIGTVETTEDGGKKVVFDKKPALVLPDKLLDLPKPQGGTVSKKPNTGGGGGGGGHAQAMETLSNN